LHRRIIDYQRVAGEVVSLAGQHGFLMLDDLYHIPRANQPDVLDYVHRLLKGTGLWLKVGTIRHRSRWYRHGDPSVGMKRGDDVEDIDLDVTLEKYETAKQFRYRILRSLADAYDINVNDLLNDGAKDRLVLASGGVGRDFLSILQKSLAIAQERDENRINTSAVNQPAGEHESSKRDQFRFRPMRRDLLLTPRG
jgi:hypothetical protein